MYPFYIILYKRVLYTTTTTKNYYIYNNFKKRIEKVGKKTRKKGYLGYFFYNGLFLTKNPVKPAEQGLAAAAALQEIV